MTEKRRKAREWYVHTVDLHSKACCHGENLVRVRKVLTKLRTDQKKRRKG